jgi:dihydropteroate synthase
MDPAHLNSPSATSRLGCRGRELVLGGEPRIVGILNVTPDSFFDGGKFAQTDAAVAQAHRLVAEGAAMIDLGGQSTRPGYTEVPVAEEIHRVVPVITALARSLPVPLSIDTYRSAVARAALQAGAHVLNDIHGLLRDPALAAVAAEFGCPVVVMHNEPGFDTAAGDPVDRMLRYFERCLATAARAGIAADRLILDPGIGFAKTQAQNLAILARLPELRALGRPLFLGASRKSVVSHVLDLPPGERLEGTLAITSLAAWHGVELIRVHDVQANLRAARMAAALRAAAGQGPGAPGKGD